MKIYLKQFGISAMVLLISAAAIVLLTTSLYAKTTVTQDAGDECKFTVTVDIAFAFDDSSYNSADTLMQNWINGMNQVWNGAGGEGQTFGECDCSVKFVFNATKLDKGKNCTDAPAGNHCMYVVDRPVNQRGNVADAHEVPPDGSMNGYGEWTVGTTGMQAAHEAGHLMGLGEGYHWADTDGDGQKDDLVNDNPQASGPQGIMSEAWGNATVLQEYVDEIMDDAGMSCPNSCCCGNGKVEGNVGEMCDPKADPNGCNADQTCNEECECKGGKEPECGDGEINGFEQCDPKASPTGCEQGEECVDCICFSPEEITPPATEDPPPSQGGDGGGSDEPVPEQPDAEEEEPEDAGAVPESYCGDGICDQDEDCENCPEDCGACECAPTCGLGEGCVNGTCMCGDGAECAHNEVCVGGTCMCGNNDACEGDEYCDGQQCVCDSCGPVCGDGNCEGNETCSNCASDCGACGPVCGDGVCDPGVEDCYLCSADCGACVPVCGDGLCEPPIEDCYTCSNDCGSCRAAAACEDKIDNDGDGFIDYPNDPECYDYIDNDEAK